MTESNNNLKQKEQTAMRPIKKTELIDALAVAARMTSDDAEDILSALSEVVTRYIKSGQAVALPDLITLEPKEQASRKVRNPATGELMEIPAKKAVRAKISAPLKAALNKE